MSPSEDAYGRRLKFAIIGYNLAVVLFIFLFAFLSGGMQFMSIWHFLLILFVLAPIGAGAGFLGAMLTEG